MIFVLYRPVSSYFQCCLLCLICGETGDEVAVVYFRFRKDVSLWLEDDHRHRRTNAAQNLALMRSALMAIIPYDKKRNLNDCFHDYQEKPPSALKLIQKAMPI